MMSLPHRIEILLGISLLLSFFSWGRKVLFPLQIFTTWIHECCHAMSAQVLGGQSIHITLAPDGSGLTHYKIPTGKLRQAIIASSGYLGSSLFGCIIFYLAITVEKPSQFWNLHSMVILLCSLIGLSIIFWIRNFFGMMSALVLGTAIASLNYAPMNQYAHEILLFIGIQTALNALFDIRVLLGLNSSKKHTSDAHTLQKLFYLPHWVWAISWLSVSLFMMYWTVTRLING